MRCGVFRQAESTPQLLHFPLDDGGLQLAAARAEEEGFI